MTQPPILSIALPSDTGRVLSIQSHTVQGYVGNKSAVFPLQLLGYPTFKGQVLNGKELWDLIEGLEANNLLFYTHLLTGRMDIVPMHVGLSISELQDSINILSGFAGYIGSVSFLNTVLEVVTKLRSVNPGLVYVCDPVMGDEGKLYIPQELVSVYREKVVPVASMLTPNQFEAELLTGLRIVSEQDGREACNKLHSAGPAKVVITSINIDGSLLLIGSSKKDKDQAPEQFKIMIPKIPAYFTGTGDLTTALLLGWSNVMGLVSLSISFAWFDVWCYLKYPDNLAKAAELAVSSLQALLQRTIHDYRNAGFDPKTSSLEIRLVQSQDDICNPQIKLIAEKYE
ncbi:hypothetical protein KSS87_012034 [Heliosperma pusillum]|nr:hypothetical protein KSS87_012034 [Heliosperma pusillum]